MNRSKLIFPELLTLYTQCVYFSWPQTFFSAKLGSFHLTRFAERAQGYLWDECLTSSHNVQFKVQS
jgi:hypothetical protein